MLKVIMGDAEIPFVINGKKYRELDGDALTFQLLKRFDKGSDVVLSEDRVIAIKESGEHELEFSDGLKPIFY